MINMKTQGTANLKDIINAIGKIKVKGGGTINFKPLTKIVKDREITLDVTVPDPETDGD